MQFFSFVCEITKYPKASVSVCILFVNYSNLATLVLFSQLGTGTGTNQGRHAGPNQPDGSTSSILTVLIPVCSILVVSLLVRRFKNRIFNIHFLGLYMFCAN